MIGRATFGDFIGAARRELGAGRTAGRGSVEEVSRSLLWLVAAMGRCVADLTAAYSGIPARDDPALGPWAHASIQARDAIANAAGYLREHRGAGRLPPALAASPLARRLDAAAVSLTTGRDLLQTHFARGPGGESVPRSEWAAAVTSGPVRRALLAEIGSLARQAAHHASDVALSPPLGAPARADSRRKLNAACQWLWMLDASVRGAQQQEPVKPHDRELLAAIPVNALPPRRVPNGKETVSELADGVIASAERVRHLAWRSSQQEPWSPAMTVASLRQVAEASKVTSHNCHLILKSLAVGAGDGETAEEMVVAADEATASYRAWLSVAGELRQVTTQTRAYLTPAAAEAADLALWTGRLAHADPGWTLSSGPDEPVRPAQALAPSAQDVLAAVHHACEALDQFAWAEQDRVRTAARAGRILVPTRTLPEDFDIPRPFTWAPRQRVHHLLTQYRDAAQTTGRTVDKLGEIAITTGAPSQVLAIAHAATSEDRAAHQSVERALDPATEYQGSAKESRDQPGPLERALTHLGVDEPEVLARGAELDREAERLLIDAASHEPARKRPAASDYNRSTATAAMVNHVLASGDPRATALLRQPDPARRQPAQAEHPQSEPEP